MIVLDIDEATERLTSLVAAIQSGAEREIVITVEGEPSALLLPIEGDEADAGQS